MHGYVLRGSSHQGSRIDKDSALSFCASEKVICRMDTFKHYTDTLHRDTTLDIDDERLQSGIAVTDQRTLAQEVCFAILLNKPLQ